MKLKLRKKMVENLQLRGYAERTKNSYMRAVRQLENYEPLLRHHLPRKFCGVATRFWADQFSLLILGHNGIILAGPFDPAPSLPRAPSLPSLPSVKNPRTAERPPRLDGSTRI